MKLSDIALCTGGELIGLDADVLSFSTDTRTLQAGDLFIALPGTRTRATDLISQAAEKGAVAALTTQIDPNVGIAQVLVADTARAMGALATAWAKRFPDVRRVAITGSAGKTSTKEFTAAIFSRQAETLATFGNLNNDLGVPMTLLRLRDQHRFGVFELGANHIGEIAYTTAMVRPHAAVITNVGTAHLEGFGSREGIAQAKGEIFDGLVDDGVAIINADDEFAPYWLAKLAGRRVLRFSVQTVADVYASNIRCGDAPQYAFDLHIDDRQVAVQLQMLGRHQVPNAVAAAALAHACGVSIDRIADGLSRARSVAGRGVLHRLVNGSLLIDDTYNANPASMKAAIDLLSSLPARRVLVLGSMGELGDAAEAGHIEVGEYAAMKQIDALYACGPHAADYARGFGQQAQLFPDHQAMIKALAHELEGVVSILVKGSRSARMETVVQAVLSQTSLVETQ